MSYNREYVLEVLQAELERYRGLETFTPGGKDAMAHSIQELDLVRKEFEKTGDEACLAPWRARLSLIEPKTDPDAIKKAERFAAHRMLGLPVGQVRLVLDTSPK